jgi:signal transduction histidine kinase/ligand-binding sensor domain-containing protein
MNLMNCLFSWKIPDAARICAAGLCLLAGMAFGQQFSVTNWGHKDGLPSTTVYAITQTTDGFLWVGTGDGLIRFDGFQFVQTELHGLGRQSLGPVTALACLSTGGLAIGTSNGLFIRWDGNRAISTLLSSSVESIKEPGDHSVEVRTRSKIFRLAAEDLAVISSADNNSTQITAADKFSNAKASRVEEQSLVPRMLREISHESAIRKLIRDASGATWVGTENQGLFRVPPEGTIGDAQHFTQATGLPSNHIWDVFEDREGNLWAGTQNGLARLRQDKFITYTQRDGLLSDIATTLAPAAGGGIWIGSQSGLEHFGRSGGAPRVLLKGTAVTNLLPLMDGTMLISERSGTQKLIQHETSLTAAGSEMEHMEQMAQSANGDLWAFGEGTGLRHLRGGSKSERVNEPALAGQFVSSMHGGESDQVWLGLANGDVIKRPPAGSRIFTTADGLPGAAIRFLSPQPDGTLWAASDRGLLHFDGERFHCWDRSSGLPGDRLIWALPDQHGNVWLGYSTGVARFNIGELLHSSSSVQALHYDFFDDGDGLKSNPEAYGASPVALTSDGRLWVSMSEGIGMIDPAHIHRNTFIPPVHVLELIADGRSMSPASGMKLPAHTGNLQISYTGISLTEPRKVHFRYRLVGFETGWQDAGTRRSAFYTNLRPGHYRFQVLAANNDGIWNETGDSCPFEILPAFYQRPWFFAMASFAALSLAFMTYRLRVRLAAKGIQTRYEERLAERTRIAQDLHDNLVQEMMGISLQLEIADEVTTSQSISKGPIRRALDLSRTSLANGRNALHLLRQKPFSRADIEGTLMDTVQSATGSHGRMRFTASGQERLIQPISGEEMLQIVREALRNAIQHAGQTEVAVRMEYGVKFLLIAVIDQGPGISGDILQSGKPGHFGIQGMRERAARMGSSLTARSAPAIGTEWTLIVPAKIAYEPESSMPLSSSFVQSLRRMLGRKGRS